MPMPFPKKNILPPIAIAACFVGAVFAQAHYSRVKTPLPEMVSTLPSAPVLKAVNLGLHTATASLVWLKINQGVYTWLDKTGKYERFSHEIQTLTSLDPKWGYPYAFGTLMLPTFGKTDLAIKLGEKGLENVPNDWSIPYYMATVYHTNLKDRLNAAKYFAIAASIDSAPESVKKIAKTYGSQKNQLEEMEKIWETLAETADNEVLRAQAEKYLLYIQELKKQR
jgi:tetratricopeptide (TPR) repeat protein